MDELINDSEDNFKVEDTLGRMKNIEVIKEINTRDKVFKNLYSILFFELKT